MWLIQACCGRSFVDEGAGARQSDTTVHRSVSLLILLSAIVLSACGPGGIGFGMVVWSASEADLPSGSVVRILSESEITDRYTVETSGGAQVEIDRWRVERFEQTTEAEAAAEAYGEFRTARAVSLQQALPVRVEPDRNADRSYRLADGEEVKILGRLSEPTEIGGLVDYWYEVMTEGGTRGYVFGYRLDISGIDATVPLVQAGSSAESIRQFMGNVWRPVFFQELIDTGRIDLEVFRTDVGLFPDPENQVIRLRTPRVSTDFRYTDIMVSQGGVLVFTGTTLQVTITQDGEASIIFSRDGEPISLAFTVLSEDMDALIASEQERRERELGRVTAIAPVLESSAYGSLEFNDDGRFLWAGTSRLVPAVIPASAGDTGRIEFTHFLGRELRGQFDGVLTFRFTGSQQPVNFLYSVEAQGLRLTWASPETITDRTVTRLSLSPVVVFFTAGN